MSKFVTQTGIERLISIIKYELNNKAARNHTHKSLQDASETYTISTPTTSANATLLTSLDKGAANGLAPLNSSSKIDATYLPSYVDDVVEGYLYNGSFYKESSHSTLITAETDKIYVDLATNKTYRYGGSSYVEISASLALGTTSETAFQGDLGQIAYTHSQATGNPHGTDLSELGDVSVGTPSNGQALLYDASSQKWMNGTVTTGSSSMSGLTDASISSPADGQLLKYNGSTNKWTNFTPDYAKDDHTHNSLMGAEGTYTLSSPTLTGNAVISIDGHTHSGYVPTSRTVAGKPLTSDVTIAQNDLSDTTISSASSGQIMRYNGSAWVNADLSTANVLSANKMSAADMNTLWGATEASAYTS